jgi:hypothetical protein
MKPDFDTFWHWLMQECRDFLRLGEQLKKDGLTLCAADLEAEIEIDAPNKLIGSVPPAECVRICPGKALESGEITTTKGNSFIFSRELAEATWHRYHGMRQAALRQLKVHSITLPVPLPHQMTSSYVKPGPTIYPLNWIDCPNPIQAPPYIAAAISYYCRMNSQLVLHPPDTPLSP